MFRKSGFCASGECVEVDVFRISSYSDSGTCVEVRHWHKSSLSMANGNCVEVTDWRTASYSVYNGNCVEVASGVLVRDSKDITIPPLEFSADAWRVFIAGLK